MYGEYKIKYMYRKDIFTIDNYIRFVSTRSFILNFLYLVVVLKCIVNVVC